jgi:branched-chain amino acid aminotransferase
MLNLPKSYLILNDRTLPVDDPSLSELKPTLIIYEVIRVITGKCLFLEDHLNRLFNSLSLADRKLNKNRAELTGYIYKLISANSLYNGNIRMDICFQQSESHFLAKVIPHSYPSPEDYLNGVKAISYKADRDNPNAKILNPSLREKINDLIKITGAWEALLVNHQEYITEGSRSNLFLVKNGTIYTPPSGEVLEGITRHHIIKLCKEMALKIIERNINYSEISQFDSAFITGTSPKILPLNKIDDITFETNNELMLSLITAYNDRIYQYIIKAEVPDN